MNKTTQALTKAVSDKHALALDINARLPLRNHACYLKVKQSFDANCFDLSTHPYALRQLYTLVNFCEASSSDISDTLVADVREFCASNQFNANHGFKSIV